MDMRPRDLERQTGLSACFLNQDVNDTTGHAISALQKIARGYVFFHGP